MVGTTAGGMISPASTSALTTSTSGHGGAEHEAGHRSTHDDDRHRATVRMKLFFIAVEHVVTGREHLVEVLHHTCHDVGHDSRAARLGPVLDGGEDDECERDDEHDEPRRRAPRRRASTSGRASRRRALLPQEPVQREDDP